MCVTTIAIPALPLAATADPALNPNQPTLPHKRKMHSMTTTKKPPREVQSVHTRAAGWRQAEAQGAAGGAVGEWDGSCKWGSALLYKLFAVGVSILSG
jgi:hypothetical protein